MKTRNNFYTRTLLSLLFFGISHTQWAQCTASNLSQNTGAIVSGHTQCGQTFTAPCSGDITAITVVYNALPTGSGDRVLYIHAGGSQNFQIIYTHYIPFESIVVGPNVFELTSPVYVNSGDVRAFQITQTVANASSATGVSYNDSGDYGGGDAWFTSGIVQSNFDLTFSVQIGEICTSSSVAPDLTELPAITASCFVTEATVPTATTNCGVSVNGVADVNFPITAQGVTTITWTYNDGFGNTAAQTQEVIIIDDEAPVPDQAVLQEVVAECELTELSAPTATDNCGQNIIGTTNTTFPISTPGATQVL